jgi:hypothetical protein
MYVLTGDLDAPTQMMTGLPAGLQVHFPRGVNSFAQMITAWSYPGFIVNQNQGPDGRSYPCFVERERNNSRLVSTSVAVGSADNFVNAEDVVIWPLYFLKNDSETTTDHQLTAILQAAGEPVKYGTTAAVDRITAPPRGPRRHGRSGQHGRCGHGRCSGDRRRDGGHSGGPHPAHLLLAARGGDRAVSL